MYGVSNVLGANRKTWETITRRLDSEELQTLWSVMKTCIVAASGDQSGVFKPVAVTTFTHVRDGDTSDSDAPIILYPPNRLQRAWPRRSRKR